MAKTTYLLGAGASAGSLPTVDGFEKKLEELIRLFEYFFRSEKHRAELNQFKAGDPLTLYGEVADILRTLLRACKKHRSIDTYAKVLFLTGQAEEYRNLKCSIILFFELCRFYYKATDKRYDAFLATILKKDINGNLVLPSDINFLSWNYDYEFEKAFINYITGDKNIKNSHKHLNTVHKNANSGKTVGKDFCILKINGTAGFIVNGNQEMILGLDSEQVSLHKYQPEYKEDLQGFYDCTQAIDVLPLIQNYFHYCNKENHEPAISFAWEDGEGMQHIKDEIKGVLSNTEKLIIIGYSFPYFNREIDKYIMDCLKNIHRVRVYVQDTKERAHELIDNIKELRRFYAPQPGFAKIEDMPHAQFYPKTDLTQFYMAFD